MRQRSTFIRTYLLPLAMFPFAAGCGEDPESSTGDGATGATAHASDSSGATSLGATSLGATSTSIGATSLGATSMGDTSSGATSSGDGGSDTRSNPTGRGPAPVDLGSPTDLGAAASYVLLAKTGISNVTGSSITGGHVGLSPAAASFITGFSLTADASGVFATSASVLPPWKIYASDYQPPTPSNLTSAVLSMEAGYTDAAGRSNPDELNLASGNIGGLTLEPGLYTWGTGVTIADDVTLAGTENDVWIFQISNDLTLSSATQVILTGGADPANVFWAVAGEVTIHANAHFEGIVLCNTGITLQTSASLDGRALAQSLIALDDNAITAP